MSLVRAPRRRGAVPFPLVYAGIALLAIAGARVITSLPVGLVCPFHRLTGLPCATCGATRALASLGGLDLVSALAWNPLATLAAIGCVAAGFSSWIRRILRLGEIRLEPCAPLGSGWRLAAVAAVALNWAYLIARS